MFENKKSVDFELEAAAGKTLILQDVIEELRKNHLKDKEEMFIQSGTVRAGIIVLVNDTDWELEGTNNYEVQPNDKFAFISTLHGG